MKKITLILILLLSFSFLYCLADTVVLKNGATFSGTVVSSSADFIVLKDNLGIEIKIPKANIDSVQIGSQGNQGQAGPQKPAIQNPSKSTTPGNETEDNNRFSQANNLSLTGKTARSIKAKLSPAGDRDYFYVTVGQAGEYQLTVSTTDPKATLGIRIVNMHNSTIKGWEWSKEGENIVTSRIDINHDYVGKRLVFEIAENGDNHPANYSLDLLLNPVKDPYETNNRFNEGRQINSTGQTQAYIFPRGDRDFYKLPIPGKGRLHIKLSSPDQNIRLGLRLITDENRTLRSWTHAIDNGEVCEIKQDFNEPPKTLYLEVNEHGDDRRSMLPYTIETEFEPIPYPTEPNNRFNEAKQVPVGKPFQSYLFKQGDRDFFKFTLDKTGLVKIKLNCEDPLVRIGFQLITDENKTYMGWTHADENKRAVEIIREMQAGDYYIQINEHGDNYASMKPYTLNISLTPNNDPFEPNNQFSTAKAINLGTTVKGTIFPKGDRDYYKVDVLRPSELIIRVQSNRMLQMSARVQTPENKTFHGWSAAKDFGEEVYIKKEVKNPGTYYIIIANHGDNRSDLQPYTLTVKTQ